MALVSSMYPLTAWVSKPFRARRMFSSTSRSAGQTFRWLDLEGAGLSMIERLALEEALFRNTRDNWILVGRHAVWPPKHVVVSHIHNTIRDADTTFTDKEYRNILHKSLPGYIDEDGRPNPNGMIVMGIGGKAEKLLNSRNVIDDQLLVVKRFSGGGTVVMDENAIWTTLIAGRKGTDETGENTELLCQPYPREIMKWTADAVFGPTFDRLNASQRHLSKSITRDDARREPRFSLREEDYVLTLGGGGDDGEIRKMGGNAQAISGRQGWLHHTSFLWDYNPSNMERYLKLPEKRPDYRVDRSHNDFLVKLKEFYGDSNDKRGPSIFLDAMKEACIETLGIQETDWPTVRKEVFGGSDAKMNSWWLENRTRIQHEL